jgi:hypothetical protein
VNHAEADIEIEVGAFRGPLRVAVRRKLISRDQRVALATPTELERERCARAWERYLSAADLRRLRELLDRNPAAYLRWCRPPSRPRHGP